MYEILSKEDLTPVTKLFEIEAPVVARKGQPGQFVIIRLHERGERISLTIAGYDRERGTITLVVQEVGKTTMEMGTMQVGDHLRQVPIFEPRNFSLPTWIILDITRAV